MPNIIAVIRAEMDSLEQQLRADPLYKKLLHLKELEALYTSDDSSLPEQIAQTPEPGPPASTQSTPTSHSRGTGKINRKIDPLRLRVLEQAANVIRGRPWPTKTAEIYDELGQVRDLIRGTDARANLSAMLHHSPMFISHRRAGWTLAADSEPSPSLDNEVETEPSLEDLLG